MTRRCRGGDILHSRPSIARALPRSPAMSVALTISRPGNETEFVPMCGQRTAEKWVGELARKHGFRILTGVYPAFMYEPGDLDQAIREISILRHEMHREIDADERLSAQEKIWNREYWDFLLARLRQLKNEPDAEAYFG